MKKLTVLTLVLALSSPLVSQDLPRESEATVQPYVDAFKARLLQMPEGTLEGAYAVKQLQGRQGTSVEVFMQDLEANFFARESLSLQRWLAESHIQKGLYTPQDLLQMIQRVRDSSNE